MKRAKKNNKGFSLVELIVVVLIIGVLGVALAPQVMKWVDNSKKNSDINNAGVITSAVQTALAEWQSEGGSLDKFSTAITNAVASKTLTGGTDIGFNKNSLKVGTENKTLYDFILEVIPAGDFPEAKYKKMSSNDFIITVYESGKVEVKCQASIEAASTSGT